MTRALLNLSRAAARWRSLLVVAAVAGCCVLTGASASPASSPRAAYLKLAQQGMAQSVRWRTSTHNWYCETLGCTGAYPLLTIWGTVRMFEAVDAVQLAAPSAAHRAIVQRWAGQAESLYWNRYLNGFDPYPGDNYPAAQAWFDDNGWLGLAFFDAYRATGQRRWLGDAQRAFSFIVAHGWTGHGMWFNTQHDRLSGEALAADSLLGMLLDQATHNGSDLANARTWIDWANRADIGYAGLYDSEGPGSTVISYVEAPLVYAQYLLCRATGAQRYCHHAAAQANTLTQIYGIQYRLAPLYDSIFMQWMMAYGKATGGNHWLGVAQANAAAAQQHANRGGLWLGSWWGGPIGGNTQPGMFRTMAGTTSLYAWLAYYQARAPATPGAPPPPVLGKSVDVAPVSGQVFVKPPRGAVIAALRSSALAAQAPSPLLKGQGFIPLTQARQIPVGSILDTTAGTVRLTSATASKGNQQSGDFSAGIFTILQHRKQHGLTELDLIDAQSARQVCVGAGKALAARKHLSSSVLGLLRSNAHGRFTTRAGYSSTSVRGTKWSVTDRCDGTLTRVTRGVVVVRDFRRHKNITVRAGKSYLAKAPGA